MKKTSIISLFFLLTSIPFSFASVKDSLLHKKGEELFKLIRSYYLKDIDSMRYYIQEAEPVFLDDGRVEDLFRVKAWYIYALTSAREDQEVMNAVNALKKQAAEMNFPDGKDMADQALADFYIETGLLEEGTALYEEVLRDMEERNSPLVKRIYIIRQLLNKVGKAEVRKHYLEKLAVYINECELAGLTDVGEMSLEYVKYLYHRSYLMLGIDTRDLKQAEFHLREVRNIINEGKVKNEEANLRNLELLYYMQTKEYDKALVLLDSLLEHCEKHNILTSALKFMSYKAGIYFDLGKGMESARVYRNYIALKDSVTNATFYNDLAQLRTRHDMDKLELKTKQMELEASKTHAQLLLMGAGLVLLIVICCMLIFISYSRHRYGLQLKAAKEKAEEADRLKSAFLANMNHEIRTPLNAIVGFSQVLIDEEDRDAREKLAEIIQNNNELLQRLIVDVLDISKIESNSMDLIYVEQDLPSLMNEIYSMVLLRMPEHIELKLEECLPVVMDTDRNRLTQILTNLLTNAIKHTQTGFIRFGYTLVDSNIHFFVEDTGEGIPEDQLERIFSRFVQLNDWDKGVGLGLAICKGLIEKMGGEISVTSEVGEGSVFYVVLPLRRPDIDNK